MTELGVATFASSVRSKRVGAGAALAPDGLPRLVVAVTLTVTQTTKSGASEHLDAAARIELLGPGDVVGIAPSEVLRIFPNAGEHAAEPNYLASIEFDSPELPWLVSLSAGDHTQPWITLVVVTDSPARVHDQAGSLLPWIVADSSELPPPGELWAWAHAHAQGDASLAAPAAGDGRRTLSRLLCPTRLQPNTAYLAAVVPTYQAGVLAARRQNPGGAGDQPSWAQDQGSIELPMYHHWRFLTGGAGDFEELARQLTAIDASTIDKLGRIELRLAEGGLSNVPPRGLDPVHTLLVSPAEDAARDAELSQLEGDVATVLQTAVDAAPDDKNRVVRPPKYGQWPAGDATVRGGPSWYTELNLQPHHRVVARLGADLVRTQQEELVSEARRQLGEYRAARRIRDLLRLGEMTATRLHERTVAAVADEQLVTMARPVLHPLMSGADRPLVEVMALDGFGTSLLAASFARIADRVSSRTGVPAAQMRAEFVAGSMKGDLVALPPRVHTQIDVGRAKAAFERAGILDQTVENVRVDQLLALAASAQEAQDQLVTAFRNDRIDVHVVVPVEPPAQPPAETPPTEQSPAGGGGLIVGPFRQAEDHVRIRVEHNDLQGVQVQHAIPLENLRPELGGLLADQPWRRALDATTVTARRIPFQLPVEIADQRIDTAAQDRVGLAITKATSALTQLAAQQGLPEAVARFSDLVVDQHTVALAATFNQGVTPVVMQLNARDTVRRNLGLQVFGPVLRDQLTEQGQHQFDGVVDTLAQRQVSGLLRYPPAPGRVTVDKVATSCRAGLRAETTYAVRVREYLPFAAGLVPSLIPMGFVPRFDAPLADRLQHALNKWVLAGADRVPPNTITVLMTNPAFIEAFTAGANHEMARELLWRDIPSDARGTVFSRFWNTPLEQADKLLQPMHLWRGPLGKNLGAGSPFLCVLVRSPLLRRYPNAVIHAAQGQLLPLPGDGRNFEPDPATFRTLLFQGAISPDISFSVIDLTQDDVRTAPAEKPWYILLGEPVTEPKFGLDATASPSQRLLSTWQDLAWTDVTSDTLLRVDDANLARQQAPDGITWGTDSAAIARILHQDPFRLVLPAAEFLGMGN